MAKDLAWELFLAWRQLPRPADWTDRFGRRAPLALEIGSGHGDFLLRTAAENPDYDFIGIEQQWERVKKTLRKAQLARAENPAVNFNNVRVLQADVLVVLERLLRPLSVSRIYCLFPCPWPKKKHIRHRLFSADFLRLVNSRLDAGGTVQLVTDDWSYFSWVLEQLPGAGFRFEKNIIPARFDTKFERKWSAGGRKQFYELCLFKEQHVEIPVAEDTPMRKYVSRNFDPQKFPWQDTFGDPSVILKDFVFDPQREKAMIHFLVAEKTLTQHLWVTVGRCPEGWYITKTDGHSAVPTVGTARAILLAAETIVRGSGGEFWATDEQDADGDGE